MGSPFCSPWNANKTQQTPPNTDNKRDRNSTCLVLEEEKAILNNLVLDLTQRLAAQQMENKLLKQELITANEQNAQSTQNITINEEMIQSLEQQLSASPHNFQSEGGTYSTHDNIQTRPQLMQGGTNLSVFSYTEELHQMMPLNAPEPVNMARSKSAPDSKRKEVIKIDAIQDTQQLNDTIRSAAGVRDVSKFVLRKYETVAYELSDDDDDVIPVTDDEEMPRDTDYNDDSSVDPEDVRQIFLAKEQISQKKAVADEMDAVKQEMNAIKRRMTEIDIMRGNTLNLQTGDALVSSGDDLELPSANLFRFGSKNEWDPNAITTHKKDMEAAMAHLLENHVSKSIAPQ